LLDDEEGGVAEEEEAAGADCSPNLRLPLVDMYQW
jgi:hypothetical protein